MIEEFFIHKFCVKWEEFIPIEMDFLLKKMSISKKKKNNWLKIYKSKSTLYKRNLKKKHYFWKEFELSIELEWLIV